MLTVAVCSLRGAPGASTAAAAIAAAWPVATGERVVLVEADPAGGVMASRWNLTENPGLLDLASTRGGAAIDLSTVAQAWSDSAGVVVTPADPEAASGLLASASSSIIETLSACDETVVVDVGRLSIKSMALPLAVRAMRTVIVCPRRLDAVAGMPPWIGRLRQAGAAPVLITVGTGPYGAEEVAAAVGAELVGSLPDDRRGAERLWAGDRRRLRRSMLWRSAREIATTLAADLHPQLTTAPPPPELVGEHTVTEEQSR